MQSKLNEPDRGVIDTVAKYMDERIPVDDLFIALAESAGGPAALGHDQLEYGKTLFLNFKHRFKEAICGSELLISSLTDESGDSRPLPPAWPHLSGASTRWPSMPAS